MEKMTTMMQFQLPHEEVEWKGYWLTIVTAVACKTKFPGGLALLRPWLSSENGR